MDKPADIKTADVQVEERRPLFDDHGRVQDMDDAVELELGCLPSPQLRAAVQYCQAKLLPLYDAADKLALRHQKRHQRLTVIAAVTGAFAVVFAIMQLTPLAGWLPLPVLTYAEALAALSAVLAVIWGVRAAFHHNWLLERHKAERYRLLKFCALFDPTLVAADGVDNTTWQQWLDGEIVKVQALDAHKMEEWITNDPVIAVPDKWQGVQATNTFLQALIKYFKVKRLGVQCSYFSKRAQRNKDLNRRTVWVPLSFFFLSVGAALLHFIFDLAEVLPKYFKGALTEGAHVETAGHAVDAVAQQAVTHGWPPHWWGLVFLAAAMPVVGAAIRTVRSANEFSRHMIRYRAKYIGLSLHVKKLADEAAALKPSADGTVLATDAQRIFLDLWGAEQIMESEHREWLRLMLEAEWFG